MGRSSALQGKNTLRYEGPDGSGGCSFGSAGLPQVYDLADLMTSIASTLEEGARLKLQHQYALLDLDADLEALATRVGEKQAIELENIAPILEKIANDDAVLKRVQRRAKSLLALAATE
jgi:hypothetical protein